MLDRHAGALGHHHGPRRVVPLPERRRAAAHAQPPALEQLDRSELTPGRTGRDLDVHRDADAQRDRVVRRAAARLLGSQLVVPRGGEHALEGLGIVADVVDGADAGRVAIGELRDEVAAPHLRRVHVDLGCETVDHPLDRDRRLGAPGAAVGRRRHCVRHCADSGERDVGDLVHAGHHPHRHHRQHRADERKRPCVADHVEVVRGDAPVAGAAELRSLHLPAPVGHRHHVLRAGLGPLDRAADSPRVEADRELLWIGT